MVFITAPNEGEAEKISYALLEAGLAACVNIVRNIRSIYRWQGKIEDETEILMIAKTQKCRFGELEEMVRQLHSYEVSEIIAVSIAEGSAPYLQWIKEHTNLDTGGMTR